MVLPRRGLIGHAPARGASGRERGSPQAYLIRPGVCWAERGARLCLAAARKAGNSGDAPALEQVADKAVCAVADGNAGLGVAPGYLSAGAAVAKCPWRCRFAEAPERLVAIVAGHDHRQRAVNGVVEDLLAVEILGP